MKNRKRLALFIALVILSLPAMAVFTGMDLDATLYNLRRELFHDYRQMDSRSSARMCTRT